jgi:hypothetical protein
MLKEVLCPCGRVHAKVVCPACGRKYSEGTEDKIARELAKTVAQALDLQDGDTLIGHADDMGIRLRDAEDRFQLVVDYVNAHEEIPNVCAGVIFDICEGRADIAPECANCRSIDAILRNQVAPKDSHVSKLITEIRRALSGTPDESEEPHND